MVVSPPKILVRLGLVEESEKWLVIKALYGLAEAPRRWSSHRDLLLRRLAWDDQDRHYMLQQCAADNNLWRIVSRPTSSESQDPVASLNPSCDSHVQSSSSQDNSETTLHGLLGVYVDDMLITAESAVKNRLIAELRAIWQTSEPEEATVGRPIRFCGFNMHRLPGGGYLLNQEDYVRDLLQRFPEVKGVAEVPCLKEEEIEPEAPDPKHLKQAQTLAGALQWITTRTRPDICFAVNKTAQLMARYPAYATKYAQNILRYLRGTAKLGLKYEPLTGSSDYGVSGALAAPRAAGLIEIYSDASFGPNNSKSQTGIVASLSGGIIGWASHRQSVTSQSSAESEMYSTSDGILYLQTLEALVKEVYTVPIRKLVYSDSLGCVSLYSAPCGSRRTRHLRLKAKGGRELLEQGFFELRHLAGKWMLADVATKALAAPRHKELVQLMSMDEPSDAAGGESAVVVSTMCAAEQKPFLSSESLRGVGSSAMVALRLLVIAVVLANAAGKWTITIEQEDQDRATQAKILVSAVLLLVTMLCVLKIRGCLGNSSNEQSVRTIRTEEDDSPNSSWSVVREPAEEGSKGSRLPSLGGDPWVENDYSGSGLRKRNVSAGVGESRAPASSGQVITGLRNEFAPHGTGLRNELAPHDTGLRNEFAPHGTGLRNESSPRNTGVDGIAPLNTGMREELAPSRLASSHEEGSDQEGTAMTSFDAPITFEEIRIHPSWKLRVPPRAFWPAPHPWAGVQGNWHQPIPVGASRDTFFYDVARQVLVRFHARVRAHRFDPSKCVLPSQVPLNRLTGKRRTYLKFTDGRTAIEEDDFLVAGSSKLDGNWSGRTELQVFHKNSGPSA